MDIRAISIQEMLNFRITAAIDAKKMCGKGFEFLPEAEQGIALTSLGRLITARLVK
jgi:hypothetical protein